MFRYYISYGILRIFFLISILWYSRDVRPSMGKYKRSDKEYAREKQLSHENKNLKVEIVRLRKLLSQAGLDSYEDLKRVIETHSIDNGPKNSKDVADRLKEDWRCTGTPGCEGYLEIVIFNKIDQEYYFRKCSNCFHRTRSQKYNSNTVKGIIKKIE